MLEIVENEFFKSTKIVNESGVAFGIWFWRIDGRQGAYQKALQAKRKTLDARVRLWNLA